MKIAVHDHENNGYPNLALMKLSAWHKAQGDTVGWFNPLFSSIAFMTVIGRTGF